MPVTNVMEKVKYTRFEYREEYLKSDEWKTLRNAVMSAGCDCECCNTRKASDVHHLVYRNIVDITLDDVIPVCRTCHEYIHQAIDDDYISQNPERFKEIKDRTLNILKDEKYIEYRDWLTSKHHLADEEIFDIKNLQGFVIQKISGILQKSIWHTDLPSRKFTGRQILKIRNVICLAKIRRGRKIDKVRNGFTTSNKRIFSSDDLSLKDMKGFKSDRINALVV